MTEPPADRAPKPAYGLIAIAVVAIVASSFSVFPGPELDDAAEFMDGKCPYQVRKGTNCLGTYFFPSEQTTARILEKAGLVVPPELERDIKLLPCNSVIDVDDPVITYRYPGLSGEMLLTARQPIDLNNASVHDLQALPGIGPHRAARILRYRELHGPFGRPADLTFVTGIGPKSVSRLTPLIATGPTVPTRTAGARPVLSSSPQSSIPYQFATVGTRPPHPAPQVPRSRR